MKYGKINRLKEDIGTAFDVLMYGSPIYQHGVKAGQWGRAAANVAGTYAGLKTEEKALGGNPASRVGRKFGLALAKSKYPRGTFNQRESMSAVWRAALLEGGWKQKPTLGDPSQRGVFEDYTPEEKARAQQAAAAERASSRPRVNKNTMSASKSRSTPPRLNSLVGDLLDPEYTRGAQQYGMGADAVSDAQRKLKRYEQAGETVKSIGDQDATPIKRGKLSDTATRKAARRQLEQQRGMRKAKLSAQTTLATYNSKDNPQKFQDLQRIGKTEGMDPEALKRHIMTVGADQLKKHNEAKGRLKGIRTAAEKASKTANNVVKPDPLYWDAKKPGLKGLGLMGAAAGLGAVRAIGNAARSVSSASSTGYADLMRNASVMPQLASAGGKRGNLQEGSKTWETRRRLYGPPGRKHKHWKFDFNNPEHVKKALHLKNDSDIKKLMKSTAKIDKHVGLKTTKGVPIQYAYRSNNRKNLYAGKTIGMRQNIISQHRKLGLDLPEGFENLSFDKINEIFKKRERHGWYKRQYKKVPTFRKLMIGAGAMWRKAKKALGFNESEIIEEAMFVESAPPAPRVCVFMEGKVATPTECDCDECLSVTRRMREGKLEETAASSFGQMLRPTETPPPKLETGTPVQVSKKHMLAANSRWRRLRKRVLTL